MVCAALRSSERLRKLKLEVSVQEQQVAWLCVVEASRLEKVSGGFAVREVSDDVSSDNGNRGGACGMLKGLWATLSDVTG